MALAVEHWADRLAAKWIEKRGKKHRVEIGWSPSGPMHIGFLREMILGDVLHRALRDRGAEVRFNLFVDSCDPLRDRERDGKPWFPFLPESFKEYVGRPVASIPDPEGCHQSYVEHFLAPVRGYMDDLGMHPEVDLSHQVYRSGHLAPQITAVLENLDLVRRIVAEVSEREVPPVWTGLSAICSNCGRVDQNEITGWDTGRCMVKYKCRCGHSGDADYRKGQVKMSWRLDWPARWAALGVTVEPFGKDHAAAGGAYQSGARLMKEVFDVPPPEPVVYEWINDRDGKPFSSSTGNVIDPGELLRSAQPEVLRYYILSKRPGKAIRFDPGRDLLDTYREYERIEAAVLGPESSEGEISPASRRNYELSQVGANVDRSPVAIPYRNLISLIQISGSDRDRLKGSMVRAGYGQALSRWESIEPKVRCAENWIRAYAPPEERMELKPDLPVEVQSLSQEQRLFLRALGDYMEQEERDAEEIHNQIYHLTRQRTGLDPKLAFQAVYVVFLGKERGPRAGWFLRSLDPDFAVQRLKNALDCEPGDPG